YFREGHEFEDLDCFRRFAFERLEFVICQSDVLVLLDFIPLHKILPLDDLFTHWAKTLLLDPAAALGVQQVKTRRFRRCRHVEIDRDRHETEGNSTGADGAYWHKTVLLDFVGYQI